MAQKILVCIGCLEAMRLDSACNKAPRWTGEVGDPIEARQEIGGQDDLRDFRAAHTEEEGHKVIGVTLR